MICCPECPNGHSIACRDCPYYKNRNNEEIPSLWNETECPEDNSFLDPLLPEDAD